MPAGMEGIFQEVLNGEYDVGVDIKKPVICDIGANLGAFAVWALNRWPDAIIHCFEPSSANFFYLRQNLSQLNNCRLYNVAVGNPKNTKLYKGLGNCGQSSLFDLGCQSEEYEMVTTVHPKILPKDCDILKIDTEGSEVDILERIGPRVFKVILLEYHQEKDRRKIDQLLEDYVLMEAKGVWAESGLLKYIHRSIYESATHSIKTEFRAQEGVNNRVVIESFQP